MRCNFVRHVFALTFAVNLMAHTAQPWAKDPSQWTAEDAERVVADSPWAQPATASFDSGDARDSEIPLQLPGADQAGMSGPKGPTDGKWDGGVSPIPKGGVPRLPITIRWDSALPIRQAFSRLQTTGSAPSSNTAAAAQKDYVLTVLGLVPAGRYRTAGQLPTQSRSDDSEDGKVDPQDPEQMLEGLMASSRLFPHGESAIRPEDVKLDAATGELHLFFPRSQAIDLKTKEVTFTTRFGSMTIQKQFRLKDMTYKGKLEL